MVTDTVTLPGLRRERSCSVNRKEVESSVEFMELARGIEPPTCGLQNRCSAIELRQPPHDFAELSFIPSLLSRQVFPACSFKVFSQPIRCLCQVSLLDVIISLPQLRERVPHNLHGSSSDTRFASYLRLREVPRVRLPCWCRRSMFWQTRKALN